MSVRSIPSLSLMALLALAILFLSVSSVPASDDAAAAGQADALFSDARIPQLHIRLEPAAAAALRADPREYVSATLIENGQTVHESVAIKLKGGAGSFRELDDRPAITLNMNKYQQGRRFHGLDKFHLNNSVQDESYLNELLGAELFRAAGIPAARVTHARVWLDDRDLGIYLLKEALDKDFLERNFDSAEGNLYEGAYGNEIDSGLERDEGERGEPGADLLALAQACRIEAPVARWSAIERHLDVDSFITFMALELITQHWDGYTQNCNNYRVYVDPSIEDRVRFIPHGMDQLFGEPEARVFDEPPTLVANAVLQNPVWRARYRSRVAELLPHFDPKQHLYPIVDRIAAKLRPELLEIDPHAAQAHAERVYDLRERLFARFLSLREQLSEAERGPVEFDENGIARIVGWRSRSDSGDAQFEQRDAVEEEGIPSRFVIACGAEEPTTASWRVAVPLEPGRYQFQTRTRAFDIEPLSDDVGSGAGIRISGSARTQRIESDRKWTTLRFNFVVEQPRTVELVAELRALSGRVWFDADSLILIRLD